MTAEPIKTAHPNGHFYSPVVDPNELDAAAIWPDQPRVEGIDFNDASHEIILREVLPRHLPAYDYPERLDDSPQLVDFYTCNPQFSWLDSRAYFALLREWAPRQVIEIGSGYSTLLVADVNRRFLGNRTRVTCIEPYPREFLRGGVPGVTSLVEKKVQQVGLDTFSALGAGDILFIDSSHVSKTGSDVNFLFFEILPRLAPGVRVHVHDIFLPHDYPKEWVTGLNLSWNEQYLLRALLTFSNGFKVVFGCSYAFWRFPELVRQALANPKGYSYAGGSFWIERA